MDEKQFWEYIAFLNTLGTQPGLDTIRELCRRLGDPQKELTFIHVAGTNGKGSTTAFLASVLRQGGYRVGRYNSPAVREYRERIMVGKQKIKKEALFRLTERIQKACDEMTRDGLAHPTSFEVETALGFLYFAETACDIVLLEAGMGGALDATNLIPPPLIAVLTSISMDHVAFLGKTLAEIAENKAGIIKQGGCVVTAPQEPKALEVIRAVCARREVALFSVHGVGAAMTRQNDGGHGMTTSSPADGQGRVVWQRFVNEKGETLADQLRYGLKKQSLRWGKRLKIENRLAGSFQMENVALTLRVIEVLREKGFSLTDQQIVRGFRETKWDGRFTVLREKPYFIIDGAHNADAAKKLADSLRFYFTNKRIIYIMGILRDKDHEAILSTLAPLADNIITVRTPDNPRAMDAFELAQEALRYHDRVTAAGSVEEAVEMAYLLAGKEDVILACGSLSYLGRVMQIMEKKKSGEFCRK